MQHDNWKPDPLTKLYQEVEHIKNTYVSKEEFNPVRKIVFGVIGLILTGVVVAILALVLRQSAHVSLDPPPPMTSHTQK